MNLAIIPARGGSKRIPKKNIKLFRGKPIIGWAIETALESKCFDRVVVSTDDDEIAEVSSSFGAEIPFIRPQELSDDYAGTSGVIAHAVEWLAESGVRFEYACCIYATAPFVQVEDFVQSLALIKNQEADYCFSVTTFPFPIERALKINEDQRCEMLQPENYETRSQDLEEAYHDAGQFYWGTSDAWLKSKKIFSLGSVPYVLPRYRVQDIDTMEDWFRAELMFEALQKRP
jgi:pseudaminic acid cytidylyltransferase